MNSTNNMCSYLFCKIINNLLFIINISAVADNLVSNVKYKVEEFTGLTVEKINIFVEGVRVID